MYSLAMITKAGVPSKKVFVGVSSYGRSFKMADAGCRGPECKFLGERNKSPAAPGECTETSGYIADAEIRQIQAIMDQGNSDATYESFYDEDSDSDIFIYNNDEWVAWMDTETKERRTDLYKSLNFAGTSDWAVDLQKNYGIDGDDDNNLEALDLSISCDLEKTYSTLDDLDKDAASIYPPCLAMHAIKVLQGMLSTSFDGYDDAASGYDELFPAYEKWIKDSMNERLTKWFYDGVDGKDPGNKNYKCYAARGTIGVKREDASEVDCGNLPHKNGDDWSFWFEIHDEAANKKSLTAAGFDPEWVEGQDFEDTDGIDDCPNPDVGCITTNTAFHNYPRRKAQIDIPNPKDVIDAAKTNITNVNREYDIMWADIGFDTFDGSIQDAVEVLSVPVFMVRDAIDSMKEVKEIAKKINDENKKNLILKIVEAVLFLIPFVGGAVGALGRTGAALARFLSAVDTAGNAGLAFYSMVEDPAMAPVAILGMLLGGLGTPSGKTYRKVGVAKREMTADMKKNMGKSFNEFNPKIESITGKMCTKKSK